MHALRQKMLAFKLRLAISPGQRPVRMVLSVMN